MYHLSKDGTISFQYYSAVVSELSKREGTENAPEIQNSFTMQHASNVGQIHFRNQHYHHLSTTITPINQRQYDNSSMHPHPLFHPQLKFILFPEFESGSDLDRKISIPLGILVGSILPHLSYQLARISGSFYSSAITPFGSSTRMEEMSLSCPDFISQTKTIFQTIDNALSLLNSTRLDIVSIEFSIVCLEKYAHTFSRELSNYMQTANFSVSIIGVTFLLPPQSKVQAKLVVLVRNALLSNFLVQKF